MKISKRYKQLQTTVVPGKAYALDEALKLIQSNAKTKFVESVDVAVRLGADVRQLAEHTGTATRYVDEWLRGQAAGGYWTHALNMAMCGSER